jgi:hypothetical protein
MMETTRALLSANEFFVRNMRHLWRLDARNAWLIDAVRDKERYPVEQSRSGEWTVRADAPFGLPPWSLSPPLIKGGGCSAPPASPLCKGGGNAQAPGNGKGAYLHSRHDPRAEAEQWAAAVDVEGAFCFVVAGFGLGYHLAALHRRLQGDAFLICTEPDVRMISTALSCVDLSELLASPASSAC